MFEVSRVMKTRVADPALRREVEAAVRRRVRGDEAEDVVQATLADVLAAPLVPEEPEEFRRYVFGVARHKVFDHFRRQRHKLEGLDESALTAPEPPLSARDILRWAEGELPDSESQSTLEWMLRESDGEKLEHIARDARVPAARVRKRVSRLRKLLRERWTAELLLIGLVGLLAGAGALYWLSRGKSPRDVVEREPLRPVPSAQPEPPRRAAGSSSSANPPSVPAPAVPSAAPSASTSAKSRANDARPVSTQSLPAKAAPPKTLPQKLSKKTKPFFGSDSNSFDGSKK
jgi:DNA-directed RNA polymerase specialized sigma24 family protein